MDIKWPDGTFDLAVDKSTIDALLCGDDSYTNVARMTKEVQRTLKVGGVYMICSYGTPETRELHLDRRHLTWKHEHFRLPPSTGSAHYIYASVKQEG
jgi:hypothetical protein